MCTDRTNSAADSDGWSLKNTLPRKTPLGKLLPTVIVMEWAIYVARWGQNWETLVGSLDEGSSYA